MMMMKDNSFVSISFVIFFPSSGSPSPFSLIITKIAIMFVFSSCSRLRISDFGVFL